MEQEFRRRGAEPGPGHGLHLPVPAPDDMDMLGLGQGREGVVPADGEALQLAMLDLHADVLDDPDVVILLGDEDLLPGDQIALDAVPRLARPQHFGLQRRHDLRRAEGGELFVLGPRCRGPAASAGCPR